MAAPETNKSQSETRGMAWKDHIPMALTSAGLREFVSFASGKQLAMTCCILLILQFPPVTIT